MFVSLQLIALVQSVTIKKKSIVSNKVRVTRLGARLCDYKRRRPVFGGTFWRLLRHYSRCLKYIFESIHHTLIAGQNHHYSRQVPKKRRKR